jgi:hypothetical protein
MLATHTFTIHAECPFVDRKQWDYYEVEIQTEDVIDVHDLEGIMNSVRGLKESQETIARIIRQNVSCECFITVTGSHTQNSSTKVMA